MQMLETFADRWWTGAIFLAGLALYASAAPFDITHFVSGDALYPVHLSDYNPARYRPPPSNNFFPDIIVHFFVQLFTGTPLIEKLIAGGLIFTATAALVGYCFGQKAFYLVVLLFAGFGFQFLDTTAHYSLPLIFALILLGINTPYRIVFIALGVFSDLLILLPAAFLYARNRPKNFGGKTLMVIAAAAALNVLYSEFSAEALKFAAVFPAFCIALYAAKRLGLLVHLGWAITAALPVGAMLGLLDARYAVPVAACFALQLLGRQDPQFKASYLAVPLGMITIFVLTFDAGRYTRFETAYDCLMRELQNRNITAVAAGHWTSKPLYFAAQRSGQPLTITQVDFHDSDVHSWMAPHAFHGNPTRIAVKNLIACKRVHQNPTYCGHATAGDAKPVKTEKICAAFELVTYQNPVPRFHRAAPKNKAEAILRNLADYRSKFSALAARIWSR